MSSKHETLSKNLKKILSKTGKTQVELAQICGVSTGTFNDWVMGRNYPRPQKLDMLAKALHVTEYDLTVDYENDDLQSYMNREVVGIAAELYDDPLARSIYFQIKQLSPADRDVIIRIINRFSSLE